MQKGMQRKAITICYHIDSTIAVASEGRDFLCEFIHKMWSKNDISFNPATPNSRSSVLLSPGRDIHFPYKLLSHSTFKHKMAALHSRALLFGVVSSDKTKNSIRNFMYSFSFIQVVCRVSHFIEILILARIKYNRFRLTAIIEPKHVIDKHNIN